MRIILVGRGEKGRRESAVQKFCLGSEHGESELLLGEDPPTSPASRPDLGRTRIRRGSLPVSPCRSRTCSCPAPVETSRLCWSGNRWLRLRFGGSGSAVVRRNRWFRLEQLRAVRTSRGKRCRGTETRPPRPPRRTSKSYPPTRTQAQTSVSKAPACFSR